MLSFLRRTALVFLQLAFVLALCAALTSIGAALGGPIGTAVAWLALVSMLTAWLIDS